MGGLLGSLRGVDAGFYVIFAEKQNKKAVGRNEKQTSHRFILEQDTGLEPAAYCLGSNTE